MATNIGPKIGVQGEGEFRKQMDAINNSLKTLTAETKSVTSAFIGEEKSIGALTAQSELLQSKSDMLNQKLDLQKKRLQELDDAGVDPTSQKYQRLLQQLYNTEAEFNKNEAEIKANKNAMDNLGKETDETAESFDKGAKGARVFGDVLKANLLSEAIKTGIHAVTEGVKKIAGAFSDAAYSADDINTLAKTTGLTTEEIQKFQYASDKIDVSLDTLTGSMSKLTKNMSTASKGTGEVYNAFSQLGVEVTDQNGEFRDRNQVFQEVIASLGKMENETQRDALAMQLFGKSAQDLNPLILGGAEALQELGAEAEAAGLILSQDSLDSLNGISDALDTIKATAKNVGGLFLSAFAGPVTEALESVAGYLQRFTTAFSEGGVGALMDEIAAVLEEVLPNLINTAANVINTLIQTIADALPKLIPVAIQAIITLVETIVDNLDTLADGAISIVVALAEGIINALPKLLEKAPVILAKLVLAIIKALPKLAEAAWEIVTTLGNELLKLGSEILGIGADIVKGIWDGIKDKAAWFGEQVKGFFSGVIGTVKDLLGIHSPSKVFATIGENMALGIGQGFSTEMQSVADGMGAAIPSPTVNIGNAVTGALAQNNGSFMGEIVLNITEKIDGATLARNQYRYNMAEAQRHGPALVGG